MAREIARKLYISVLWALLAPPTVSLAYFVVVGVHDAHVVGNAFACYERADPGQRGPFLAGAAEACGIAATKLSSGRVAWLTAKDAWSPWSDEPYYHLDIWFGAVASLAGFAPAVLAVVVHRWLRWLLRPAAVGA